MGRKWYHTHFIFILGFILLAGLTGCSNSNAKADAIKSGTADEGSILHVAFASDPDTIDWMYTGATATRDIGWHIFETLFALDKSYKARPMIAEKYDVNDDGTVYTISIRRDVNFHDGSAVTAEDAAASIERWRKVSSVGKIVDSYVKQVSVQDDHTVVITLKKAYTPLLTDMAAPKSALIILPKRIAEAAEEQPLQPDQLIGTGPYKFKKWDRGDAIVLTRFDDYTPRTETDWGGLTGKKTADFAEIDFEIVKDPQVMLNGLKTGLYDYAENIPPDLYQIADSNPAIDPVTYINGYATITPDKSEPPFDDLKVRQALNYALDKKGIAKSAYGNEAFYSFDGALFAPEQKELYTKEGTENYLVYDKKKAKSLLAQSNYNGEPLKLIYSSDTGEYAKISQVIKQQLEEAGFSIELIPYEWAAFLDKWGDPANWDLEVVGWSTRFSPSQLGMLTLNTSSSGWYKSKRWEDLLRRWGTTDNDAKKKEILAGMNQTIYDELPFIKLVNIKTLDIKSAKLKDYDSWVGQRFWNTTKGN